MKAIEFPNPTTITLAFGKYCRGWENGRLYDPTYAESPEFRAKVLKMLLDILDDSEKPQWKDSKGYPQFTKAPPPIVRGSPNRKLGKYACGWFQVFERSRTELGVLRMVHFGRSNWDDGDQFGDVLECPNKYMASDDGIGPSQWVEKIISTEYAGMEATPPPNCDEEDKAALLALMKSIGQPIPADANTNGVS
ncbi:uncharacterized protein K441DRAFT_697243 [Cenococcum geophilum 1.58]|uniref:uncharacterized protein n=1 Tax=Cenococcum geophilum 1.58 TaxID=794803 RepID=UPI00358F9D0E|nr:hypothetical protein K441DRAFT_697243 [Cenococcum geophilum 1.58]